MEAMTRHSWEIISDLCDTTTVKALAYHLRYNKSLVYAWTNEPDDNLIESPRRNPLDRTQEIISFAVANGRLDLAVEIISRLCDQLGGLYTVQNVIDHVKVRSVK